MDGNYRYHVHAFDQAGNNTTHIADNDTVVQVFYDVNKSRSFFAPNSAGDLWTVFDYNKDTHSFSTLNTMASNGSDGSTVDNH